MSITVMNQAIPILTEPFVRAGVYPTSEQAMKHIILDYIERQISWAEVEIEYFERKYKKSFSEWSKNLMRKATVTEEDDWMEWESLRDMVVGWRELKTEVEYSNV